MLATESAGRERAGARPAAAVLRVPGLSGVRPFAPPARAAAEVGPSPVGFSFGSLRVQAPCEKCARDRAPEGLVATAQLDQDQPAPGIQSPPMTDPAQSDAIPLDDGKAKPKPAPAPAPAPSCTFKINYSGMRRPDLCAKIWTDTKKTPPPAQLCGSVLQYDITSVTATGSGCPKLEGLMLTEDLSGDHGCTPRIFDWNSQVTAGCKIGPGGALTGCTDTYSLCGDANDLQGSGKCTEVVTQKLLVGGTLAETHTLTYTLDDSDPDPRKPCKGKVDRS